MRMPMLALLAAVLVLAPTLAQGKTKSCFKDITCRRCFSHTACKQCKDGFVLSEDKRTCKSATAEPEPEPKPEVLPPAPTPAPEPEPEPEGNNCKGKISDCKTCESATRCKTCKDGRVLAPNKKSCKACEVENCRQCKSNGKKCQKCKEGFAKTKKGRKCSNECQVPNCEKCKKNDPQSCQTCAKKYKGRKCNKEDAPEGTSCIGKGDAHFYTFDGMKIDFQGVCTYNMMETLPGFSGKPLKIHCSAKKLEESARVSFIRDCYVWREGYEILLTTKFIKVNGVDINSPWSLSSDKLEIRKSHDFEIRFPEDNVLIIYKQADKGSVSIYLPDSFKNNVAGLCGNFDGDRENDLIPKGGTEQGKDSEIGDSHLVSSEYEKQDFCKPENKPETPETTDCSETAQAAADGTCDNIMEFDSLKKCAPLLTDEVDEVLEDCGFDLCRTAEESDKKEQLCRYAESLVCRCLSRMTSGTVKWRTELGCPMDCEKNSKYTQGFLGFEPSCAKPEADAQQTILAIDPCERCVCEEGFYRLGPRCVSWLECGCVVTEDDETYNMEIGQTRVTSDCSKEQTCESSGKVSEEEREPCHEHAHCGTNPKTGERGCVCNEGFHGDGKHCAPLDVCKCSATGDVHFTTCDRAKLTFQGNCTYELASTDCAPPPANLEPFSVTLDAHNIKHKNRPGLNTKVSFVNKAYVTVYGETIELGADGPQLNGAGVSELPPGGKLKLNMNKKGISLRTDFGLVVKYQKDKKGSGRNKLFLEIPAKYSNHICGLCGNFNGNKKDDRNDRTGVYQNKVNDLGDSFRVPNSDDEACQTITPPPPTECNTRTQKEAAILCAELTKQCDVFTEDMISEFTTDCSIDVCAAETNDEVEDVKCDYAGTVVEVCNELADVPLNLEQAFPECGEKCDENEERKLMEIEDRTCGTLDMLVPDDSPEWGCACKEGFVRSGERCVSVKECGCQDELFNFHPFGTYQVPDKCNSQWECGVDHVTRMVAPDCPPTFDCSEDWRCVCPELMVEYEGECHESCTTTIKNCLQCKRDPRVCAVCARGYFLDPKEPICKECPSPCTSCKTADACGSCEDKHRLENEKCVEICEVPDCKACVPGDGFRCKTCQDTLVLQDGECVRDCTAETGGVEHCTKCDKEDVTKCKRCGQRFGLKNNKCIPCPENCMDCNQNGNCRECDKDFFVKNGQCVETCKAIENCRFCEEKNQARCAYCKDNDDKKRPLYLSKKQTCEVCEHQNCVSCGDDGRCAECKGTWVVAKDGSCKKHCRSEDSKCNSCDKEDKSVCQTCHKGFFLTKGKKCEKCMEGCTACADGKTCEKCGLNKYYNTKRKTCDDTCEPLDNKCLRCDKDQPAKCDKCFTDYYVDKEGKCQKCNQKHCQKCAVDGTCEECKHGHFLSKKGACKEKCDKKDTNCERCAEGDAQGSCKKCKDKFYLGPNGVCKICLRRNCAECDNDGKCIRCKKDSKWHRILEDDCHVCKVPGCDQCFSDSELMCKPGGCKKGFFLNDEYNCVSDCSKVVGHCKTCDPTDRGFCVECEDGYFLRSTSKARATCEPECDIRDRNCERCSRANHCTRCKPRYDLDSDDMCRECTDDENCKECEFSGKAKKCVKCQSDYFLNGDGACQENCQLANVDCKTCDFDNPDRCVTCKSEEFFVNDAGTCRECRVPDCKVCNPKGDGKICLTCDEGFQQIEGACINIPVQPPEEILRLVVPPEPEVFPPQPEPEPEPQVFPPPPEPEPQVFPPQPEPEPEPQVFPPQPEPEPEPQVLPPLPELPEGFLPGQEVFNAVGPEVFSPESAPEAPSCNVANCEVCESDNAAWCRFCRKEFLVNAKTGQCEDDRSICEANAECADGAECEKGYCQCLEGSCGHGGAVCRDRCKCTILGDPELESFDNMVMLMGYPNDVNRRFTMTKNVFNISDPCSFDVEVELGPVDNKYGMQFLETLPQALYIKMLGNLITLRPDNRASVGGTEIDLEKGIFDGGEFTIELARFKGTNYVKFESEKCDISIGFFRQGPRSEGVVDLPCKYAGDGRLTGLCGTCDGRLNDLTTAEGVDVSHSENRFKLMENSFEVPIIG